MKSQILIGAAMALLSAFLGIGLAGIVSGEGRPPKFPGQCARKLRQRPVPHAAPADSARPARSLRSRGWRFYAKLRGRGRGAAEAVGPPFSWTPDSGGSRFSGKAVR